MLDIIDPLAFVDHTVTSCKDAITMPDVLGPIATIGGAVTPLAVANTTSESIDQNPFVLTSFHTCETVCSIHSNGFSNLPYWRYVVWTPGIILTENLRLNANLKLTEQLFFIRWRLKVPLSLVNFEYVLWQVCREIGYVWCVCLWYPWSWSRVGLQLQRCEIGVYIGIGWFRFFIFSFFFID